MIVARAEGLAGHPAVGHGALPAAGPFALPDDHAEAVVAQVERLPRALHAVADHGDGLVPERFERPFEREFFACDDVLLDAAEIDLCHSLVFFML